MQPRVEAGSWVWGVRRGVMGGGLCQCPGATSRLTSPDTNPRGWELSFPSLTVQLLSGDLPINKSKHLKNEPGTTLALSSLS